MMQNITEVIIVILGWLALSFVLSYPLMLLWNGCLVPAINVIDKVTWLQMWGISILCQSLFKTNVGSKK